MSMKLSDEIQREVETAIRSRSRLALVIDVYATAEEIRRRHAVHEIGLDDIAATVARLAAQSSCAVEFGGAGKPAAASS